MSARKQIQEQERAGLFSAGIAALPEVTAHLGKGDKPLLSAVAGLL